MVRVQAHVVEFAFFRPNAREVFLVGDFNGWRKRELRMLRSAEGYWHASLRLLPGDFKFRYLADGEWFIDYAAFGIEAGPTGFHSVVRVPARAGTPEWQRLLREGNPLERAER